MINKKKIGFGIFLIVILFGMIVIEGVNAGWTAESGTPATCGTYPGASSCLACQASGASSSTVIPADQLNGDPGKNIDNDKQFQEKAKSVSQVKSIQGSVPTGTKISENGNIETADGRILAEKSRIAGQDVTVSSDGTVSIKDPGTGSLTKVSANGAAPKTTLADATGNVGPRAPAGTTPTTQTPGFGTGSGLGGSGGGAGGGEGGGFGEKALAAAQQAMSMASSILGPIKDALTSNGKGETTLSTMGDGSNVRLGGGAEMAIVSRNDLAPTGGICDYQVIEVCEGNQTRVLKTCERSVEVNRTTFDYTTNVTQTTASNTSASSCSTDGLSVTQGCEMRTVCVPKPKSISSATILAQNDKSKEAVTTINYNGDLLSDSKNLEARVLDQATIETPANIQTDILLKGISGNPEPAVEASRMESVEREIGTETISGKAIADTDSTGLGDQFVKLVRHDLDMSGKEIVVYAFKSFDNLEGIGSNLTFTDGATDIVFNRQKTYYPREVKSNRYFVNKISNVMDPNKITFRLEPGGDKGNNFLVDGKRLATVGDIPIAHPKLKGILIAKERESMFKVEDK